MLIDSNIIIYAAQPAHPELRKFIADHPPAVSVISYIEVVGFHRLMDEERKFFQAFLMLPQFCRFLTKLWNGQFNSDRIEKCHSAMLLLRELLWLTI